MSGTMAKHGLHHSAQKSTSTGWTEARTSPQFWSVKVSICSDIRPTSRVDDPEAFGVSVPDVPFRLPAATAAPSVGPPPALTSAPSRTPPAARARQQTMGLPTDAELGPPPLRDLGPVAAPPQAA